MAEAKISRIVMCRNIKTLFNFEPPATDRERSMDQLADGNAVRQIIRFD